MIRIFSENDTSFITNGDIVFQPLKAKIRKVDNGDFYLEFEAELKYAAYLTSGKIAVVDTPQGRQGFRIRNITKMMHTISCKAWHLFYDTYFNCFVEQFPASINRYVYEVLPELMDPENGYLYPDMSQFSVSTTSTKQVLTSGFTRCSLFDIFMDVADRADLHIVRNNFSIVFSDTIGEDRGLTIRYASNLKDITKVENWDNVCTRIYPTGKDGARLTGLQYIDSETQYDLKYSKTYNFTQDYIKREYYQTEAAYKLALESDLRDQATAYLAAYCFPEISYTIKAYVDSAVDIGDTVRVIDEDLDIDLLTRITSYEYNCLSGTYTDVTFGNQLKTAKGLGYLVDNLRHFQQGGIIGTNQLVFNGDGTVSYVPVSS